MAGGDHRRGNRRDDDAHAHVYRIGGYERVVGDAHAAHAVVEKTRAGAALQVRLRQTSSSTPAAAFEYLHTDHLGTTAAATDATGASLLALAHDPYGTRRKADWTAQLPESDVSAVAAGQDAGRTRRGFTGHEQLDRTGLVHMGGRLYDPRTGRFLSPDPVVSEPWSGQSWNLYSYVGNSPVSYADPTGLFRAGPGCNVAGVMCLDDGGGPGGGFPDETTTLTSTRFGFGFLPRPVYSFQWIALPGSLAPGGDVWGSRGFPGGFAVASLTYVSTPYVWTDVRSQRMVADGGPHPADGPMAAMGSATTGLARTEAAIRPVAFVGGAGDRSISRIMWDVHDDHGKPEDGYFTHGQLGALAKWIDERNALGVKPVVIGHSWGAVSAMRAVKAGHKVHELADSRSGEPPFP